MPAPPSVLADPPRARTIRLGLRRSSDDDGLAHARLVAVQRGECAAGQGVQAAGVGDLDDGGGAVERGDGVVAFVAGGRGDGDRDAAEPGVDGGLRRCRRRRRRAAARCSWMPRSVSPLPRWWTTSAAVRLPLNLSGARRTFMTLSLLRRR